MIRAYKTELDPTNKQRTKMASCIGASRFVYNWALADRIAQYEAGTPTNQYAQCKRFNSLKREQFSWLTELPYDVIGSAFANLDVAYQNFFRRVKQGKEKPGFPKFRKRSTHGSFQLRGTKVTSDAVRLIGIGWVKLKERNYLPVGIELTTYATISEQAGRWYISVQAEVPDLPKTQGLGAIGIDRGVKQLAVCSDGTTLENPRVLEKYERKLTTLQRELSRRKKGSANRAKTKAKIAKLHQRIANIRSHNQHQFSHHVTEDLQPAAIVLEDLNVKGMMANDKLAKALSDASMSELGRQIEYKAGWRRIEIIKADRWFASSKTCSRCGCVKSDLTLADRIYACPECGLIIDRDLNAAINLAALGEGRNAPGLPVELRCCNASL